MEGGGGGGEGRGLGVDFFSSFVFFFFSRRKDVRCAYMIVLSVRNSYSTLLLFFSLGFVFPIKTPLITRFW